MYILILMLLLAGSVFCQSSNVWNGITPLKSTKADVEKILGKPEPWVANQYAAQYKAKDGEVSVLYSTGMCDINPEHGWNIPLLTVISLSYYPDYPNPYKFSELKLDLSKFQRNPDPGSIGLVFYTNEADGIALTVDTGDDSVRRFGYFPESKYNHLMCKNIKTAVKSSRPKGSKRRVRACR